MTEIGGFRIDPKLDLVLERIVDVAPELVWKAWTTPEHLVRWFAPKPWSTVGCELDLRPGGAFKTVMRSPEGEEFPNEGCYLDVVTNRRLVWTDTLGAGYRPKTRSGDELAMTAAVLLEPQGKRTRYVAIAIHAHPGDREKHEQMGFHEGWGKALDQLVEHARTL